MERMKGSGDSEEVEQEARRVQGWGGNLESIRWLSWSCLHSCGGESGKEAREGTGLWELCHELVFSYNLSPTKITTAYSCLNWACNSFMCLNGFGHFFLLTAPLGPVESSCSQKSPTSPQLRSKWRVRTDGWHTSRLCQHGSSHYSLTPLPLVTSLHWIHNTLLCTTGSMSRGIWQGKKGIKHK